MTTREAVQLGLASGLVELPPPRKETRGSRSWSPEQRAIQSAKMKAWCASHPKPTLARFPRRRPGRPAWTEEQRTAASLRVRQFYAAKREASA